MKQGLEEPLSGMGTAFSSSLFGLGGSLILGCLDIQSGQAQNRFYNEAEERLSQKTKFTLINMDESERKSLPPAYLESLIEVIIDCIECINTEEEKIMIRDEPREKIVEFVDSMTNEQFAKLRTYVESVPKVEIPHEYVCGGCKEKKEVKIRNISDFF